MQPEIIDYYTVNTASPHELQNRINILIKEGYQPFGGMSMTHNTKTGTTYFRQALVKYKQPQHKELTW